jgi:hypothetical protein
MFLACCANCCLIEATSQAQSSSTRSFPRFFSKCKLLTLPISVNGVKPPAIEASFAQSCSAERDSLGSSNEDKPSVLLPSEYLSASFQVVAYFAAIEGEAPRHYE